MSSHFACLGIPVDTPEDFDRMLDQLGELAQPTEHPGHFHWIDPSGAAIAFHVEDDQLACVTPFFAAPEPCLWKVRTYEPLDDEGCPHCGGADCDLVDASGQMLSRACVQWVDYQPDRAHLAQPRTFALQVTLFTREAHFYDTPEAFTAAEPFGRLATQALMPYGMFSSPDKLVERASVIVTGPVLHAAVLRNQAVGSSFVHVRVDTMAGAMDAVLPGDEAPQVGGHAALRGWLVGRPSL